MESNDEVSPGHMQHMLTTLDMHSDTVDIMLLNNGDRMTSKLSSRNRISSSWVLLHIQSVLMRIHRVQTKLHQM